MKHYIAIEEIRRTVIEVEANSSIEALSKVENAYCEDKINLNDYQYISDGTQFYDETDTWCEDTETTKDFLKIK